MNLEGIPSAIVERLEADRWTIQDLALATIAQLSGYDGVGAKTAAKIISLAQTQVNEQGLYESAQQKRSSPVYLQGSTAAFPEEWLSGEVEPPPMSVRVKRAFEGAVIDYRVRQTQHGR